MKFTRLDIADIVLIKPKLFKDPRGFFFETYSKKEFSENGIPEEFVQDNHSKSMKGTLRGLHYQEEPMAQSKLIRIIRGEIFDVMVDIRKDSPTFGKWIGEYLSEENRRMLYVPKGFAHGFLALQDNTELLYKVTEFYSPDHERGIAWNDPDLDIKWPEIGRDYILSDKDYKNPRLREMDEI